MAQPLHGNFHQADATAYDARIGALVPGYDELHRIAAAALAGRFAGPARVLVSGAGTGKDIESLALANARFLITALEPSRVMLNQARLRCEALAIGSRVTFVNASQSEFSGGEPFDAATSLLVSHFMPDDGSRQRYYRDLRRCLASRGALLLAEILRWPGCESLWSTWRALLYASGCTESDVRAAEDRMLRSFALITEHRLEELLLTAGFTRLERIGQLVNVGLYFVEC